MLIRSLAPMTRPLIFEPRPARAELTRPIDMPAAPAVLRKSLRPTGPLFSDMCPSRVGMFVNLSVALWRGWGLGVGQVLLTDNFPTCAAAAAYQSNTTGLFHLGQHLLDQLGTGGRQLRHHVGQSERLNLRERSL